MKKNGGQTEMGRKVSVVGLWHLGAVTSACLAELGFHVIGIDENPDRVVGLQQGRTPLFEPGLEEMLRQNLNRGRLEFTTDLVRSLRSSSFVLLTYDTPVDDCDRVDLSRLYEVTEILARHLDREAIVIVNSQVPVGTCEAMQARIRAGRPERPFGLAYVPENLRLGRALERFLRPSMIVMGSDDLGTLERVEEFYSPLPGPRLRMNLRSAEMTKHALNAYLAACVSFINEIANLCDEIGADAAKVVDALRHDERVSPHAPLDPGGLGFAGGTLARDLRALESLGVRVNHPTHLVRALLAVNDEQKCLVWRRLLKIYGSLQGLTIGILGLTYKPGTSTLRRSVALEIVAQLVGGGAKVKAYDPKAALTDLGNHLEFEPCTDPLGVAAGSDALVILTEWPEFRDLDYHQLGTLMKQRVLIDTKNLLNPSQLRSLGFRYFDIGRGGPVETEHREEQVISH